MKYLYMELTTDEYELPLCVADSVAELARLRGVSENSVYSALSRSEKEKRWSKYGKVPTEGEYTAAKFNGSNANRYGNRNRHMACMSLDGDLLMVFGSTREAAEYFCGAGQKVKNLMERIQKCANGKTRKTLGHRWRWI